MKAIVRYIFIVIGLVVLGVSTSRTATQYLVNLRDIKNKWWGLDEMDHGDLASMAYLYQVPLFAAPKWVDPPQALYTGPKLTNLYIHGDSYTRNIKDPLMFAGLYQYHFIHRNTGGEYQPDSTKKNVLILEISERYVRDYFSALNIFNELRRSNNRDIAMMAHNQSLHGHGINEASFGGFINTDLFFNKYINQNLQFHLFNYQLIMPMFGYKAAINYYLFHRASGDVVISKNKQFLFLKETVSVTGNTSSYAPLNNDDIQMLTDNINAIYDHYKKDGFNEVYLSIIPNSATINQPEGYNNLIPLLQNNSNLKMKVIDTYTAFKKSGEVLYWPGDTHWNPKGLKIWLDLVNEQLVK